jgi:hypothetical protein
MFRVGRPYNDINASGLEYLREKGGREILEFDSEEETRRFLAFNIIPGFAAMRAALDCGALVIEECAQKELVAV